MLLLNYSTMEQDKKTLRREGLVLEALPSTHFRVRIEDGKEIIAHLAGRLRIHRIKVLPGDMVTIEQSPYDETKGRIVYRGKKR